MSDSEPPVEVADWKQLALSKRVSVFNKIPNDWLLPIEQASQYTETNAISVLEVTKSIGLLTQ